MSIITLLNKIADRLDELELERFNYHNATIVRHSDGTTTVDHRLSPLSIAIREILADPNNDIHGTEL